MSGSSENIAIKQPIRRLEIQINNFNVAVPHHVDLLKRHKNNINKYQSQHDWEKVRKEHANVSRIIKQLKELLYQMDTLRAQVLDADINEFDKLTFSARSSIMNAIQEYLELQLDFPLTQPSSLESEHQSTKYSSDSSNVQLRAEQEDMEQQLGCLYAWNGLQDEIYQLHKLFADFNKIVYEQKESVNNVEDNIEATQVNITEGTKDLAKAARYKVAAYPLAGALIGTCIGGPVGLLAGMKIGGLAALGCGLLGFTGGSLLKKKTFQSQTISSKTDETVMEQTSVEQSGSTSHILNDDKKSL